MSRLAASAARIEARAVARKAARIDATKRKATRANTRRKRARTATTRREATKRDNRLRAEVPRLAPHLRAVYDEAPDALRRLILEQARDERMPFVRTGPALEEVLAWKSA